MKTKYKKVDSVQVGEVTFDTLIKIESEDGDKFMHPVIRISGTHNTPFYQDIVLNNWSGLPELAHAITNLDKKLDKMLAKNAC
jgi:hypothetical protein